MERGHSSHRIWHLLARPHRQILLGVACAAGAGLSSGLSDAFDLSPTGTTLERITAEQRASWYERWVLKMVGAGIRHFAQPVHEEITHRIYDCDADAEFCAQVDIEFAPQAVLYGVRWNDDPPFGLTAGQARNTNCKVTESIRLVTQPACWRQLFNDAEQGAVDGKQYTSKNGSALLYRVHFGDLQFLHAMASEDGEVAAVTQAKILTWAEFVWRVATGEYKLGLTLKDVGVNGLSDMIGRPEWRVQDLFTYGIDRMRPHIRDVAFGSLLHVVEDSFAKGHADRGEPTFGDKCPNQGAAQHLAPGRIASFHAYNRQDHAAHSRYDARRMLMTHIANTKPHVVSVGRVLRQYYEDAVPWETVKPYVACVFAIADPTATAGPGEGFGRGQ
jgi:hypothetical protein